MLAHEAIIFYDHDSYNILYNICTNQCSALSIFIMHQFCNINESKYIVMKFYYAETETSSTKGLWLALSSDRNPVANCNASLI